jgi:hypothetical protein
MSVAAPLSAAQPAQLSSATTAPAAAPVAPDAGAPPSLSSTRNRPRRRSEGSRDTESPQASDPALIASDAFQTKSRRRSKSSTRRGSGGTVAAVGGASSASAAGTPLAPIVVRQSVDLAATGISLPPGAVAAGSNSLVAGVPRMRPLSGIAAAGAAAAGGFSAGPLSTSQDREATPVSLFGAAVSGRVSSRVSPITIASTHYPPPLPTVLPPIVPTGSVSSTSFASAQPAYGDAPGISNAAPLTGRRARQLHAAIAASHESAAMASSTATPLGVLPGPLAVPTVSTGSAAAAGAGGDQPSGRRSRQLREAAAAAAGVNAPESATSASLSGASDFSTTRGSGTMLAPPTVSTSGPAHGSPRRCRSAAATGSRSAPAARSGPRRVPARTAPRWSPTSLRRRRGCGPRAGASAGAGQR